MANPKQLSAEALAKQNADLLKKLEEAEAAKAKAEAEKEELRLAMDKGEFVGEEIDGYFTTKVKNVRTGKTAQKKFSFARGHKYLFIDGKKMLTTAVMQIAAGEELDEDILKANIQLKDLTTEGAKKHLEYLAKIGYGYLVEVK